MRKDVAKRLFDAYDADGSGSMDLAEFVLLVQRYDPSVDPAGVERSFEVPKHCLEQQLC